MPYPCTYHLYFGLGSVRPKSEWRTTLTTSSPPAAFSALPQHLSSPFSVIVLSSQYLFQRGPIWLQYDPDTVYITPSLCALTITHTAYQHGATPIDDHTNHFPTYRERGTYLSFEQLLLPDVGRSKMTCMVLCSIQLIHRYSAVIRAANDNHLNLNAQYVFSFDILFLGYGPQSHIMSEHGYQDRLRYQPLCVWGA